MKAVRRAAPCVELNDPSKRKIELLRFGREKNPVLVVDDVFKNPDALRAHALGCQFFTPPAPEPGYVTACPLRGVRPLGTWVAQQIFKDGFGLDPETQLPAVETDASFRVFAPAKGRMYGTIYVSTRWLEAIIGLTPGEEETSGTAFWRHAPTGLESAYCGPNPFDFMLRVDAMFDTRLVEGARVAHAFAPKVPYSAWVNSLYRSAAARPPFPSRDHGVWELIGSVPARYNRLVAFPTWQFRGVHMKKDTGTTLASARLTMNVSIGHPAFEARERLPAEPVAGLEA
jgi:hypothetical protein